MVGNDHLVEVIVTSWWVISKSISTRCKDINGIWVFKGNFLTFVGGGSDHYTLFYFNIKELFTVLRISTCAQYVTPDNKIYCEKVKMCRFSSGNWFFCTKFGQLAMAGESRNTVVHLQKREW